MLHHFSVDEDQAKVLRDVVWREHHAANDQLLAMCQEPLSKEWPERFNHHRNVRDRCYEIGIHLDELLSDAD